MAFHRMGREYWISGWGGRCPEPILRMGTRVSEPAVFDNLWLVMSESKCEHKCGSEWERLFTWQTKPTASMAHFSKHFVTLSSAPVASQLELLKAEIWKRGISCKTGRQGCERMLNSQTLCNENTLVIFTFLVLYQLPISLAGFSSHKKHVLCF